MPIEPWFSLAVYYADVENAAAQKKSLVSAILELETTGYDRRVDSETAWTGDFHGVGRIHTDPRFSWIVEQVEAHTINYLTELGIDLSKIDLYIQRAWSVVSRHDREVPAHSHHNAHSTSTLANRSLS